jgi:hypothetical protein
MIELIDWFAATDGPMIHRVEHGDGLAVIPGLGGQLARRVEVVQRISILPLSNAAPSRLQSPASAAV